MGSFSSDTADDEVTRCGVAGLRGENVVARGFTAEDGAAVFGTAEVYALRHSIGVPGEGGVSSSLELAISSSSSSPSSESYATI